MIAAMLDDTNNSMLFFFLLEKGETGFHCSAIQHGRCHMFMQSLYTESFFFNLI